MLKPGDPAPQFDLPCALNGQISQLSLSKIASETIVIFFYPHDFSFICPTEVVGFNILLLSYERRPQHPRDAAHRARTQNWRAMPG
jgi:alkyl hydroperoxide reductase subunit AhpC